MASRRCPRRREWMGELFVAVVAVLRARYIGRARVAAELGEIQHGAKRRVEKNKSNRLGRGGGGIGAI